MTAPHPLHIGIVCEEYPPGPHGGIGSVYRDLAEGLVTAGHRVTVIGVAKTVEYPETVSENHQGVRVIRMRSGSRRVPHLAGWILDRWRLKRTIQQLDREAPFDLIEAADYHGWLPRGTGLKCPLIVRIHGSNLFYDAELSRAPQKLDHRYEKATLARATHVASVSRYAAEKTFALAGMTGRNCEVIPNAVDTDYFSPSPDIAAEPGLVVFVNMVTPRKGIEQLILAANQAFPSRPASRLVVVGTDPRGESLGFIEHLRTILRPELRDRVFFTGRLPRDEVRAWLRRASVCCYPSQMETFGIAPVEAMSLARATIFTKLGPGPEIIEHGQTGLLCDPRDPADIADCLARFLDDPGFAARAGSAARAKVLSSFDSRDWIPRNIAYYQRCLRPDVTP